MPQRASTGIEEIHGHADSPSGFLDLETPRPLAVEWPTLTLYFVIMGLFILLTLGHKEVPAWALFLLGGVIVTWYGSFQHEVVHGHPTPWPLVNRLLVIFPLTLWLPFEIFRSTHLLHHRDALLTDPRHDPESFYFLPQDWRAFTAVERWIYKANNTLVGRLLLNPLLSISRLWSQHIADLIKGDFSNLGIILTHCVSVGALVYWITSIGSRLIVGYAWAQGVIIF